MKRREIIKFKAKTIIDGAKVTVRGSGCHQRKDGKTYIFGTDKKGVFHEVEVITETVSIERDWYK